MLPRSVGEQPSHRQLEHVDLGEIPYAAAQADMARWVEERKQGLAANRLFPLTHPAVITYTVRTPNDQLPDAASPIDLVQTDRGGHATYHGPGQLIGYLVLNVRELALTVGDPLPRHRRQQLQLHLIMR